MKYTRHPLFLCGLAVLLLIYGFTRQRLRNAAFNPASASQSSNSSSPENEAAGIPGRDRSNREVLSNKNKKSEIPDGISEEAWTQASTFYDMMASRDKGPAEDTSAQDAKQAEDLKHIVGLDPKSASGIDSLIASRNEAQRQASREATDRVISDPKAAKEMIALSIMSSREALTPEQQAKMDKFKKQMEAEVAQKSNGSWHEDEAFVASIREQLPDDNAERLDDYVATKKKEVADRSAFQRSRELGEKLSLNADQRQAMYDLYRQNPEPSDDQIMPLLSESQQAAMKANANKK